MSESKKIIVAELHGLDPLFEDAARLVLQMSYFSISNLQRKLNIGYNQACKITDELEEIGIIGPIINPMVPREILINDEKKLEDVLLSIQKNGKVYSVEDEVTRLRIEEIKEKTIDITSDNCHDYCPFEIIAFSYSQSFSNRNLSIITIHGDVFQAHSKLTIDELLTICPPLGECGIGVQVAETVPEDYSYFYMGAGNHLFVNDVISDEVKKLTNSMDKNDLRQQWEFVVMKALENKNRRKKTVL